MCGICFASFTPESCLNMRALSRTLLEAVEERGREATGYAYVDADNTINTNNAPVAASEFTRSRREFGMDAAARTFIGHTRLATKGSINNPLNNHPVLAWTADGEQVAAVHNGGVWNDDEMFDEYRLHRYGQVDSEIIPAMLAAYGSTAHPEIFAELTGGIATAWLDERTPGTLHALRAWDSPMVIAHIDTVDRLGFQITGVIGASTVKALTAALGTLGLDWSMDGVKQYEIGEGEYLSVTNGVWDGLVHPFSLPEMTSRWGSSWRGRNRRTQGGSAAYNGLGWGYYGGDDEWAAWEGNYNGIGSGKVDSGKPSTYVAEANGDLTPLALDDSIGPKTPLSEDVEVDEAVESWWSLTMRAGEISDLADRRKVAGYVPDAKDMRLLASATDVERITLGVTIAEQAGWNADYMWHMEACDTDQCRFSNPDCPWSVDTDNVDEVSRAAQIWGLVGGSR